jgi:predicted Rossmann-fold nucleotide-binding protein
MTKPMPIVLFGTQYWRQVIDFDALVRHGTISPGDVDLVYRTDSVDEAYEWLVQRLREDALDQPHPRPPLKGGGNAPLRCGSQ